MNPSSPTLGDLVAARPDWAPVLESLGLDYCCGGHRSLDEAARALGLDGATVLKTLRSLPTGGLAPVTSNPANLPTPALIDHIVATHHAYVRRELPRLTALASKVAAAHGGQHREAAELGPGVTRLAQALSAHLAAEEEVLFPALGEADQKGIDLDRERFASFFDEHEEAGGLLHRFREITAGFSVPEWGCPTYRSLMEGLSAFEEDLHQHVHLENNVLFPRFGGRP